MVSLPHRRRRRNDLRGSSSNSHVMDISSIRTNNSIHVILITIITIALISNTHLRDINNTSNNRCRITTCNRATKYLEEEIVGVMVPMVRHIITNNSNSVETVKPTLEVTINNIRSRDSIFVRITKHLDRRIGLRHRSNLPALSIIML